MSGKNFTFFLENDQCRIDECEAPSFAEAARIFAEKWSGDVTIMVDDAGYAPRTFARQSRKVTL
jgi:hypothetical protein